MGRRGTRSREERKAASKSAALAAAAASGSDFAQFCVQLAQLGLSVREVVGDGNCMFRAVADQIDGSDATHAVWRRRVCRHMAAVPDDFAPFVVFEDGDEEEDSSFDAYLARMRSPGEWGGHLELRALVDCAACDVVVHNFGAPRYVIHKRGDAPPSRVVIKLPRHDYEEIIDALAPPPSRWRFPLPPPPPPTSSTDAPELKPSSHRRK